MLSSHRAQKSEYTRRFSLMASEVINGLTSETKWSDMYSVCAILYRIIDNFFVTSPRLHLFQQLGSTLLTSCTLRVVWIRNMAAFLGYLYSCNCTKTVFVLIDRVASRAYYILFEIINCHTYTTVCTVKCLR